MSDTDRLINRNNSEAPPYEAPLGTYDKVVKPVLAEFIGTTLFVFIGCCSGLSGSVGVAFGHGLTIALLIMGLGSISGGHFNPVVSLGVVLAGGLQPTLLPGYFIAQMLGGILGAALVRGVMSSNDYLLIKGGVHHLGDVEPGWGILIETILTCLLVFTIIMVAVDSKTKTSLAPLAIGFAVLTDILAGGALTGASMNPARAFGPALCAWKPLGDSWDYHYIYWIGPSVGAVLAAALHKFFFTTPETRWVARAHQY